MANPETAQEPGLSTACETRCHHCGTRLLAPDDRGTPVVKNTRVLRYDQPAARFEAKCSTCKRWCALPITLNEELL